MRRGGIGDVRTYLLAVAAALLLCAPATAAEAIRSTFDTGVDGWRVVGDTQSTVPEWRATGGNPGGFVRTHDVVIGGVMYWSAPAKFRGNISTSYGMLLSFDLRQSANFRPFNTHDVRIVSPGLTLHFDHSPDPALTSFTRYSIRLDETAGWYKATTPRTFPTSAEMLQVLRDVRALEIRAEFETGPDSDDLDNVVLEIESDPPETLISAGPEQFSPSASARFEFGADEAATFECRVDDREFGQCTSPHLLEGLADGAHTFEVRATDAAGNVDATPARHIWTVDTRPPDTTITAAPAALTSEAEGVFGFTADEQAAFECSLDGGDFGPCSAPRATGVLTDGEHEFAVRAVDRAGHVDPTPARHVWTVDTRPPETTITAAPSGTTHDERATFEFRADEQDARFECRVDEGPFETCVSPHTTATLGDGEHHFAVRATDRAGNTDASPAEHAFTVKLCKLVRQEVELGGERVDLCI